MKNKLIEELVAKTFELSENMSFELGSEYELIYLEDLGCYWFKERNWFFPKTFSCFKDIIAGQEVAIPKDTFPVNEDAPAPFLCERNGRLFILFRNENKKMKQAA